MVGHDDAGDRHAVEGDEMITIKRYGWIPSLPDHRDVLLAPRPTVNLPPAIDLRPKCPPIFDQGDLGSCTANAIVAAMMMAKSAGDATAPPQPMLSRLFVYYNERLLEGSVGYDSGAQIRTGFKVIATIGCCPEETWPYDVAKYLDRPDQIAYDEASGDEAITYARVPQNVGQMRAVLATGMPIVVGFSVFDGFESAKVAATGIVQMPLRVESLVGGHATLVVGYADQLKQWLVRNSWGTGWGIGGYFWMPYEYLENPGLANDFWTVSTVT